jgi:hypothetical protein
MTGMRLVGSLFVVAATLCIGPTAQGQSPSADQKGAVHRLVQRFYDWYLPQVANPHGQDVMMKAATHGPIPFDPQLVRWLRIDSTARARAKGEIDGLDGDPFLNAQDPCDTYTVQSVRTQGAHFLVDVLGHGGCAAHTKPDVTVELTLKAGQWTVTEFRDPSRDSEGVLPLLKRLHPKSR